MDNNEKEAMRWYRQGTRDARTAMKNAENGDFEVACFLFQQASEKILKAFLYLKGERAVLGHSTLTLAKKCAEYKSEFEEVIEACIELDVFYIPTRYPNGLPDGVPYEYYKSNHAERAKTSYDRILKQVNRYHPLFDVIFSEDSPRP